VSAEPLAEAAPNTAAHHPPATNLRVLVVDDNACAREVLCAMAESLGWQVDTAPDGETALELVEARRNAGEPPHQAMFIDWQMPGMDGWRTIEALQSTHTETQPPIVVMVTAHGRDMLTQRSAQDQARLHGFLVKPVTASMLLDAVSDALASRTSTEVTPDLPARPQPLKGLRLLVVEDNFVNQQVAQEMLSQEGAKVELADNGQLGVEAVRHAIEAGTPFDAVLMDIQMPVMDGYDATRMLRQQLGLTALPIIAMTANAMASDREACLAVGMNDHIGKPFNLAQLVGLLLQLTKASTSHAPLRAKPSAPASSAPPEQPLPPKGTVDVAAALERLGGNQTLYARVLEAFLKDLVTQPAQLAHCLEHADLLGAARLLHTLKGLAATVGASYLAAVARKCELAVKAAQAQTDTVAALDPDKFYREFNAAVANTQTVLTQVAQVAQGYASPRPAPPLTSVANSTLSAQALDLLAQLHTLLRASDMQAVTVFEQLGQSDALNRLPDYEALAKAMAAFDFAGAAVACELLRIQAEKI
jgi:CheY-like chemotaxis protein